MTGVFEESQLRSSLEIELSRSRRFGRGFAFVLVGIDEMRQRFDYRDEEVWQASFAATAELLRGTRANVDRVYRYGPAGFALLLPESGPKEVNGLVRRLRRVGRKAKPPEGEPGGPLPAHYGATFFPTCATTVDDLLRRAEIALKISDNNASRVQLDGAEAPEMPPVETLRQLEELESAPAETQATPVADVEPIESPALRIVGPESGEMVEHEPVTTPEEPVVLQTVESQTSDEGSAEPPVSEPETPQPILAAVEEPPVEVEPEPIRAIEEPAAAKPVEPAIVIEEPVEVKADTEPEVAPIYAVETPPDYSMDPDAIEVDEEPPLEVFAYRAPEPAIDVYNRDWQTEAPLSVIRRPQPAPKLVAVNAGTSQEPPVDNVVNDALKQLDDTLELIRSLKQRSA
jgi:GGDEF domain-containing protein